VPDETLHLAAGAATFVLAELRRARDAADSPAPNAAAA
jgi:hypothetical protein